MAHLWFIKITKDYRIRLFFFQISTDHDDFTWLHPSHCLLWNQNRPKPFAFIRSISSISLNRGLDLQYFTRFRSILLHFHFRIHNTRVDHRFTSIRFQCLRVAKDKISAIFFDSVAFFTSFTALIISRFRSELLFFVGVLFLFLLKRSAIGRRLIFVPCFFFF